MKRILLSLVLTLMCSIALPAKDLKATADSLYAARQYQKASQLYEQLLDKGDNANVYYNLGNAYYRMHDIARAILNYERAANREPGDSDIRFNLTLARSKTIDKIESNEDFFIVYWFRSFLNTFNTYQWGRIAVFSFVLALIGLLAYFFVRRLSIRKIGFGIAVAMFFLTIVSNIFAYLQRCQYLDNTHAIVMQTSKIRSTPAESGTVIFSLHEGTKVKIIDNTMRHWVQIRLADGKTGWMPQKDMEMI